MNRKKEAALLIIFLFCFMMIPGFSLSEEKFSFGTYEWKGKTGRWSVENGILSETSGNGGALLLTEPGTNYVLEFYFRINEISEQKDHILGVGAMGLTVQIRPGTFGYVIIKKVGDASKIVSAGFLPIEHALNKWYKATIIAKEGSVELYREGQLMQNERNARYFDLSGKISFYTYGLKASFKEIRITPLPLKTENGQDIQPTRPDHLQQSRNLLLNGDLEMAANPDMPDGWGYYASLPVGEDKWHYDDSVSYSGGHSVRIQNPLWVAQVCPDALKVNTPYTWSAYIKADRESVPVEMSALCGGKFLRKEINAGKEWSRFTFTFEPPGSYIRFTFAPKKGAGTVWIDAIQFEEGNEATAFTPSAKDEILKPVSATKPVEELPSWEAPFAKTPPNLDGKLDDDCWQKATVIEMRQYSNGKPAPQKTLAYLCKDNQNLYIGIRALSQKPDKIRTAVVERDGAVWGDESVEIFLDPNLSRETYYQLVVNTTGTQYDAYSKGYFSSDSRWNGHWQTKTHIGENEWCMEAIIPLANFTANPPISEFWGIIICRNDAASGACLSTSFPLRSFHEADKYGRYHIIDAGMDKSFLQVEEIAFMSADPEAKSCFLNLAFRNPGKETFKGCLIKVNIAGDEPKTFELITDIQEERKTVKFGPFAVPGGAARVNTEIWSGENILLALHQKDVTSSKRLKAFFRLSFYSNEPVADLHYSTGLDGNVLIKGEMVITVIKEEEPDKALLTRNIKAESSGIVEIPLNKIDDGRYMVRLEIQGAKKEKLAAVSVPLVKLPPKANEVKIDRIRRCLVVDGKPFFVLAYGMATYSPPYALGEEVMKYLAESGFKTVLPWSARKGEFKDLDNANKYGLKVIAYVPPLALDEKGIENTMKEIERFKDHPALLFWGVLDEPTKQSDMVRKLISEAKRTDPYHPAWVNHIPTGMTSKFAGLTEDILSIDFYMLYPQELRPMSSQGYFVRKMMELGAEEGKPVFMWLVSYGAYEKIREPTPLEQEGQTYSCVIEGARGILYFTGLASSRDNREKIASLNKELEILSPALFSIEPVPEISVNKSGIRYTLRKVDKEWYLITVNTERKNTEAIYDLSNLKTPDLVAGEVMFENRKIKINSGTLSDSYLPYQRHVYRMSQVH